ncbi:MAG TPA: CPBP family intramembrane glutamic endopeptidase [Candidatus Limnocylindrales bacterium]|nr:CPBP family intramembrane glutamic endopeptidase [Candidatus Limnocylindrales bacterium]
MGPAETRFYSRRLQPAQDLARTRIALVSCVALLGLTAVLVGTVVPAWAYPLINTVVAALLIAIALKAGTTQEATGLRLGRRTVLAALIGLVCVAAVLATGWALPPIREVFTASPAAGMTSAGLLWAVLVRVPFGTVLLEEVAFRGVLPALLGADGKRWRWWQMLGASALFGLFHLFPALRQGRCDGLAVHSLFCAAGPVLAPAAVMTVAMGLGVLLCLVRHIGGGLLAPFAVHTAANSAGYILAWASGA